jgi:hypothetical protein
MRIISFLAALLLLTSCKRNPPNMDFNKDVELPGSVVAEFYNKAAMDSLVAKINAIPEMAEDIKTARLDTLIGDIKVLSKVAALSGRERIPFTERFRGDEFLIITSDKNAAKWQQGTNSYGFNVKQIKDYEFSDMEFWKYHTGGYSPENSFDSIRKDEVQELKVVLRAEQEGFENVKYLVTVCDVILKMPRMADTQNFEDGRLVSYVKVYHRISGAKMAQGIVVGTNNENIPIFSEGVRIEEYEQLLFENILERRDDAVMDFLRNDTSNFDVSKPSKMKEQMDKAFN